MPTSIILYLLFLVLFSNTVMKSGFEFFLKIRIILIPVIIYIIFSFLYSFVGEDVDAW